MSHEDECWDEEERFNKLIDTLRAWFTKRRVCMTCAIAAMGYLSVEFICANNNSAEEAIDDGVDFCDRIRQHIDRVVEHSATTPAGHA